jgi:hypothetical protein
MKRYLGAALGLIIGAAAGYWLPFVLISHPGGSDLVATMVDIFAIMGLWLVLVPAGAILGLAIGLYAAKPRQPGDSNNRQARGTSPTVHQFGPR